MRNEQSSSHRLNFSSVIPSSILQTIAIDVVFPYMLYQFLSARLNALLVLALVALLPVGHIIWQYMQQRILDLIGILTLYVLLWAFVGELFRDGNALLLLGLHAIIPIALLGIITLLSRLRPLPLFFSIDRYSHAQTAEHMADYTDYWHESSNYRQMIWRMNNVWGFGQLIFALLLLAFALLMPTFVSSLLVLVAVTVFYIALTIWTIQYENSHNEITEA
ncbi:hypothetical protein KDA_24070 [Dictyobacter alpinus]|uniref:Uncharacterized protein n=1 Tax=Dictyobacter alpinus TaxID=2014873 RepID=A0A402B6D2_9CHLR|nr:hypothetical protein [Dictyobacter alpinus]GCE26923.1 hypothetical protein KDA_24070 [Dictyobacter alpinus]